MDYKDYYKILGVPRSPDKEIKAAYRKLARSPPRREPGRQAAQRRGALQGDRAEPGRLLDSSDPSRREFCGRRGGSGSSTGSRASWPAAWTSSIPWTSRPRKCWNPACRAVPATAAREVKVPPGRAKGRACVAGEGRTGRRGAGAHRRGVLPHEVRARETTRHTSIAALACSAERPRWARSEGASASRSRPVRRPGGPSAPRPACRATRGWPETSMSLGVELPSSLSPREKGAVRGAAPRSVVDRSRRRL
jgi:hypothetical protein